MLVMAEDERSGGAAFDHVDAAAGERKSVLGAYAGINRSLRTSCFHLDAMTDIPQGGKISWR
jgi:hypothetical protein